MTPQERKLVDELFERLRRWRTRRAIRTPSTRSTRAWIRRRTRSIRWCRPCWCRTRRSSAPTRASASSRRSSASTSRKRSRRAASSTTCATLCSASPSSARLGAVGACRRASPNAWGPAYNQGAPIQPQQPHAIGSHSMASRRTASRAAAVRRRLVPRHRGGDGGRRGRRRAADEQLPRHVRRPAARAVAQRVRSADRRRAVGCRQCRRQRSRAPSRARRHRQQRRGRLPTTIRAARSAPGCSTWRRTSDADFDGDDSDVGGDFGGGSDT